MRRFRNQTTGLPVWWVEVLMLALMYYSYSGTRSVADANVADAMRMGQDLLRLEVFLHIDIELALNRWLLDVPAVAVICCYYYATLHFIVTPALLVWTHRRNTQNYAQIRWTLIVTTLVSLVGFFLFPTAPPRLLEGTTYVDTMARFEGWGWWSGSASAAPHGLEGLTNQFAALPSLHCAWSLWCGFLLVRYGRHRVTRVLGVLYPSATLFVVMSTSNHYLLDAVAGWSVLAVAAVAVAAVFNRRRARAAAANGSLVAAGGPGTAPPSGDIGAPVAQPESAAPPVTDTGPKPARRDAACAASAAAGSTTGPAAQQGSPPASGPDAAGVHSSGRGSAASGSAASGSANSGAASHIWG